MQWTNTSTLKHTRWEAGPYTIQKAKQNGVWRLFTRDGDEPLRVIFVGPTKKSCQEYAEVFDEQR